MPNPAPREPEPNIKCVRVVFQVPEGIDDIDDLKKILEHNGIGLDDTCMQSRYGRSYALWIPKSRVIYDDTHCKVGPWDVKPKDLMRHHG